MVIMNSFTACFHFWLLIASFEINFSIISVSSGHFFLKNFNSEKKIVLQKKRLFLYYDDRSVPNLHN